MSSKETFCLGPRSGKVERKSQLDSHIRHLTPRYDHARASRRIRHQVRMPGNQSVLNYQTIIFRMRTRVKEQGSTRRLQAIML